MKNEKKYMGFLIIKNIANFEGFWQDKNFSKNLFFLGSGNLPTFGFLANKLRENNGI